MHCPYVDTPWSVKILFFHFKVFFLAALCWYCSPVPVAAIGAFVSAVSLVLVLTLLSPVSGEIDGFRSSLIYVNYRGA